jgi:phosphoglycolate phosphatase-like HAD superfamily hydrolase
VRPVVVLFDIDGTLISTGGAGRRAMEAAFTALGLGPIEAIGFGFGGMTDRAILRRAIRGTALGQALAPGHLEDRIDAGVAHYLDALEHEVPRSPGFKVFEGVVEALEALEASTGEAPLAVGLGTGNVRRGAESKLRRAGLWHRFAFGGFGCDDESRPALIEAGIRRGAQQLGVDRGAVAALVIGDTPADIEAARACDAGVVAVATGAFERRILEEHGADVVCDSLSPSICLRAVAEQRRD